MELHSFLPAYPHPEITMTSLVAPMQPLALADIVLLSTTPSTARAYRPHIHNYLISGLPLERMGIERYLSAIDKKSSSTRAQALAALKKLASVAHANGQLSELDHWGISEVSLDSKQSSRLGRWLTKPQIQKLYSLPDRSTVIGKRDAAIMALLLGCGLRREEACSLPISCYQERDGRMCLVDFWGKGSKQRTVPVPRRAQSDLEAWLALLLDSGLSGPATLLLRRLPRSSADLTHPLNPNGLWFIVNSYAKLLGMEFSPHDLRRSMARAMRKAGAPIEQIRLVLGHASIQTTERYIGAMLELEDGQAATDLLEL